MPRKGENIYKRKDGRWEGRYIKCKNSQGKSVYGYVYAPTYKEVRSKLSILKGMGISDRVTISTDEITDNIILFQKLADEWLLYIKSRVKESSYIKYRNIVHSYLLPRFGQNNVLSITTEDIDNFCQESIKQGGLRKTGLSAKTVTDTLSVLKAILSFAEKKKNIKTCDCKGILIKKEKHELCVLSRYNQQVLMNYLLENLNNRNLGIIICLCTGLRIGELCALRWGDISFDEKTIYIQHTMQRIQLESSENNKKTSVIITSPKSSCSIRHIPLSDFLLSILENPIFSYNGYVLTGDDTKFIEPRTMENHFKRTLAHCNLPHVKFHVLRHTFATRCVEVGFDIKSLSEILGHASVSITMNRYVHPSMELKRENMQKLSDLFTVK